MFQNLKINIFLYYFLTVITFLLSSYYLLVIAQIQNLWLLGSIMLSFALLGAFLISKLAVNPLEEHISNLQNLSKETLHELNLPISTIMTNSNMLQKHADDEKELKRIRRIQNACGMLQERYNELDYMIKKQSSLEIKEEFFLDALIKERAEFLKQIYPHMKFNLDLEETKIYTDKTGLSKVIDNLIDNGVKYSPNSDIYDIKLKDYTLYMQDYGCGMDEVQLIQIFDRYYQSNKSMQGFGIGLSLVKRFCDTNKIKLSFNSKVGSGTTVILKFKET